MDKIEKLKRDIERKIVDMQRELTTAHHVIRLLASWNGECPTTEHRFKCPLIGDEPQCIDCQIQYAYKLVQDTPNNFSSHLNDKGESHRKSDES